MVWLSSNSRHDDTEMTGNDDIEITDRHHHLKKTTTTIPSKS